MCVTPRAHWRMLMSNCARRKSYQIIFGQGFDSPRLHQYKESFKIKLEGFFTFLKEESNPERESHKEMHGISTGDRAQRKRPRHEVAVRLSSAPPILKESLIFQRFFCFVMKASPFGRH